MKKLIFGLIIFNFSALIIAMEETIVQKREDIFSKLDPELQIYSIEQGIKSELNSNSDPVKAIINAFKYLNNITSIYKYWYLKRVELLDVLKQLAKEKFAPEYIALTTKELNQKLADDMNNYIGLWVDKFKNYNESDLLNLANYKNDIVKLIIAGADVKQEVPINSYVPIYLLDFAIDYVNEIHLNYLNDIDFIRFLIAFKADLNTQNYMGDTPLMRLLYNASNHHDKDCEKIEEIVKLFIAGGANVNIQDVSGETPLISAVRTRPRLVKLLIERGAEIDIKDENGKTALDYAREKDDKEIINLLTKKTNQKSN